MLIMKIPERRLRHLYCVFIANFEHVLQPGFVLLLFLAVDKE